MTPQSPPSAPLITGLLLRAEQGDRAATEELFPLVYDELRTLAERYMRDERSDHTLQPTALVHEAYLRLVGPAGASWENRRHFFSAAARAIRRILTDHARARDRRKRGGGRVAEPLSEIADDSNEAPVDVVALDDALTRLTALDPQKAAVVELRFFSGLSLEDTARALGISFSTVAREWRFARIWLYRELSTGHRS
ncbi:MAG: sigma-70 family RNA polymerase sigma factor [Phycisphaerae bacterium]|nr:sigma-70 family RNA polymerase sigma factor [Phycisphaerae bacterium]NUQ45855.1 sigma-70 family RNA polymerase sigma factor [Phycisphaerae bacterium]